MSENNSDPQQADDTLAKLEDTINKAPIDEIRAAFAKDLKFDGAAELEDIDVRVEELGNRVEELGNRAALADPIAIRELIRLHKHMTQVLELIGWVEPILSGSPDTQPTIVQKTPPEDTGPTSDWRNEVNHATKTLYQKSESNPAVMEATLEKTIALLPYAKLSFPLDWLIEPAKPADNYATLVSDLCDRLIQRRLHEECKQVIARLVRDSIPPPGLQRKPRKPRGPTHQANKMYVELDRVRTSYRNEKEREELRERLKQMCSPKDLLKQLNDKRKSSKNEAGVEFERDSKIESNAEASLDEEPASGFYTWEKTGEEISEPTEVQDGIILTKTFSTVVSYQKAWVSVLNGNGTKPNKTAGLMRLKKMKVEGSLADHYELNNPWLTRAALLPPLTKNDDVIKQWVNAAVFRIICHHRGNIDEVNWLPEIYKRIEKTGSALAGIALFYREGFDSLSGKDRRK